VDANDPNTAEWLKGEQEKFEVQNFINKIHNIQILSYEFNLDFQAIEINGDKAVVRLVEGNDLIYSHLPNHVSRTANINHVINLKQKTNGWVIISDQYMDDLKRAMKDSTKENFLKKIRDNHDRGYKAQLLDINLPTGLDVTSATGDLSFLGYDNTAAVTYADNNATILNGPIPSFLPDMENWNSQWPTTYKRESDNDCTNFVSQAIFEGVSYTATDPNYLYPDSNHYNEWWYYKFSSPYEGGSLAWTRVGELYNYITTNYFDYEHW
jgi:hypothetical protein